MKKILLLLITIWSLESTAQVLSLTPQANAVQVTSNTIVTPGAGTKTYIVCPGVILNYSESSTMDTIILRSGSTLIIDSAFSYGYANIYAQAGSTIDMNFRQTGSLTYEAGVTILDTNIAPPSFFINSLQVTTIQISNANLPGGVSACTPLGIQHIDNKNESVNIYVGGNVLNIKAKNAINTSFSIINAQGQKVKQFQGQDTTINEDISMMPNGIYWLTWISNTAQGVVSFMK